MEISNKKHFITEVLTKLTNRKDIGRSAAYESLKILLDEELGISNDSCFGAFLASMQTKGATIDEITGLMDCVMNYDCQPVEIMRNFEEPLCGIVGSGKDELKTFNISSLASIVAASCGVRVLKNGSRSEASVSGTTDIFESVGFKVENISLVFLQNSINKLNFGFCDAKQYFPKMGTVYMGKFYFVHPLSYILPVASGCKFDRIVFGLSNAETEFTAKLLNNMGYKNAMVVSGFDQSNRVFDEISNVGMTKISEIKNGEINTYLLHPEDCGLKQYDASDIEEGSNLLENKEIFLNVLNNTAKKAQIEIVALNAGALIYLSGKAKNIKQGVDMALAAIRSKKTLKLFNKLLEYNKEM